MVNRRDLSIFVGNLRELIIDFAVLFLDPDESVSLLLHTRVQQGLLPLIKESLRVAFGSTMQILLALNSRRPICCGVIHGISSVDLLQLVIVSLVVNIHVMRRINAVFSSLVW